MNPNRYCCFFSFNVHKQNVRDLWTPRGMQERVSWNYFFIASSDLNKTWRGERTRKSAPDLKKWFEYKLLIKSWVRLSLETNSSHFHEKHAIHNFNHANRFLWVLISRFLIFKNTRGLDLLDVVIITDSSSKCSWQLSNTFNFANAQHWRLPLLVLL